MPSFSSSASRLNVAWAVLPLMAVALGVPLWKITQLVSLQPANYQFRAAATMVTPAQMKNRRHVEQMTRREAETRFAQGVNMLRLGQYEHALTAFHRVLALRPQLPEAHVNIGFTLYEMGKTQAALDFFRSAEALAPRLDNALYGQALALLALGDAPAAHLKMQLYLTRIPVDHPFRAKAEAKLLDINAQLRAGTKP